MPPVASNNGRSALGPASVDASDATESAPLWTGSFASHKHRQLHYAFEHGAYGIPKRHPVGGRAWQRKESAVGSQTRSEDRRSRYASRRQPTSSTGASSATGPPITKEKLGGESVIAEDGRRLGLNSPHSRAWSHRPRSTAIRSSGRGCVFSYVPTPLAWADGVGGWASRAGADPALFSRLLMHFCAAELSKFDGLSADELAAQNGRKLREWQDVDPVEVMHTAWERCVRRLASRRHSGIVDGAD
ncbi:hypothetical protein L1887_54388 [Cichorium endivia]|nr:hypothetical protein L1887_54388 [Cichorium endivia]